ncbi:hypothetical protein ABZ322_42545, partial [Streptomyces sp. NPDC006129]
MGRAHVSTHQLVAGRYRLLEIIQRETNRICWYAEDIGAGDISRPCLVTQIGLPDDPVETERRTAARLLRTSESMALLCPGRIATVVDAVEEAGPGRRPPGRGPRSGGSRPAACRAGAATPPAVP